MRVAKWLGMASVVVLVGAVIVVAKPPKGGDASGDTSAKTEKKPKGRLTFPWNEMTSLSEAEKGKILEIHLQANEERKRIDLKEHSDIEALLSDPQKAEEKQVREKHEQELRDRAAAKKTGSASTQGSDSSGGKSGKSGKTAGTASGR